MVDSHHHTRTFDQWRKALLQTDAELPLPFLSFLCSFETGKGVSWLRPDDMGQNIGLVKEEKF